MAERAVAEQGLRLHLGVLQLQLVHALFPDDAVVKNLPANAGDVGSVPGSGRSPGEETIQSSILV